MTKSDWELKSLVYIVLVCYSANVFFGWTGWLLPANSLQQMMFYQMGNAVAIAASVMAGRYTGLRGQHVTASAYILVGITHGISLGALSRSAVNPDRAITMVLPMVPALISMFWCDLFPRWVRVAGMLPVALFVLVYVGVVRGGTFMSWPLIAGYATLQVVELIWAIYLVRDYRAQTKA